MLRKWTSIAMAVAMFAGVMASTASDADARSRRGAVAVGAAAAIIGLGILGATAHARNRGHYERACYKGPRVCHRTADRCWYNRFGDYVCRRGTVQCHRRTYCD